MSSHFWLFHISLFSLETFNLLSRMSLEILLTNQIKLEIVVPSLPHVIGKIYLTRYFGLRILRLSDSGRNKPFVFVVRFYFALISRSLKCHSWFLASRSLERPTEAHNPFHYFSFSFERQVLKSKTIHEQITNQCTDLFNLPLQCLQPSSTSPQPS